MKKALALLNATPTATVWASKKRKTKAAEGESERY